MRTLNIHKQKPVFRIRETYVSDPVKSEMIQALQAVVDSFGDSDSILAMQCKAALNKAKRN